jgi:hypothetical protein
MHQCFRPQDAKEPLQLSARRLSALTMIANVHETEPVVLKVLGAGDKVRRVTVNPGEVFFGAADLFIGDSLYAHESAYIRVTFTSSATNSAKGFYVLSRDV